MREYRPPKKYYSIRSKLVAEGRYKNKEQVKKEEAFWIRNVSYWQVYEELDRLEKTSRWPTPKRRVFFAGPPSRSKKTSPSELEARWMMDEFGVYVLPDKQAATRSYIK